MAIPVGVSYLRSYQLFQWAFLCYSYVNSQGYSYGYACGVFTPPKLPAIPMAIPQTIPMAIPMGISRLRSHQLFLWLFLRQFLWGVQLLQLPVIPMAIPMAIPIAIPMAIPLGDSRLRSYQLFLWLFLLLFLWLFLWGGPASEVTSYSLAIPMALNSCHRGT